MTKQKLLALFLSFILTIEMCCTEAVAEETDEVKHPRETQTYATSRSQADAIAWVKSKLGQAIDYDGVYGAQCVDLIMAYYAYLGVSPASGNGCDYAWNALPAGWNRIQGAVPQMGDILVYSGNSDNPYGHVAIFESTYSTYHQNIDSAQYVRNVNYAYNKIGNSYWGVIRPNFSGSSSTQEPWIEVRGISEASGAEAKINGYIRNPGGVYITTVGVYIWDANDNLIKEHYEEINPASHTRDGVDMWFYMNKELGISVQANTIYKYQMFAIYNNGGNTTYTDQQTYSTIPPKWYESQTPVDTGADFYTNIIKNDGWVHLGNTNGNMELTVNGMKDGSDVWHFIRQGDGSYEILSCLDGKALTVQSGGQTRGTNIMLSDWKSADSQKWYVYGESSGKYVLQPKHTDKVLDVYNGDSTVGTNVHIWDYTNGNTAQMMALYKVDRAEKSTLSVTAGNSDTKTAFSWTEAKGASGYRIRINKGEKGNTALYKETDAGKATSFELVLPEGYYEASLESYNSFSRETSNTIAFTVEKSAVPDAPDIVEEDWEYSILTAGEEKYVRINAYVGNGTDLIVPDHLGGYPVYEVMLNSRSTDEQERYERIRSVVFPDTTLAIWGGSCMYFTELTDVTIPEGTEFIGPAAFMGCPNLKSLTIPASVSYIEDISDNKNIEYHVQRGSCADRCLTAEGKKVTRTGTKVPVKGILIEGHEEFTRTVSYVDASQSRTICLEASFVPANATDRQIYWSVDDPEVLFLNESLMLNYGSKAYIDVLKGGTATVTATTADGGYVASYTIDAKVNIACQEISLDQNIFEYDGTEKCPSVTVKGLKEGTDYTVAYSNNVKSGTGKVTIKGIGANTGSVTKSFTITPGKSDEKPSKPNPPETKPSDSSGVKPPVSQPSGGIIKEHVSVKKPSGLKVKNIKKKKARITWKKVRNVNGYEIYRSTKKSGKYKKIKTIKKGSTTSYTNSKLKNRRQYYYKIRAYKVVNGQKYYSTFTGAKGVKIKR